MTGMMAINSTACLLVLSILTKDVYCRGSESSPPVRFGRAGGSQEYAGGDLNFWPVRGRREDGQLFGERTGPVKRTGRRSREEGNGVFWAGRGRSFDTKDLLDPDNTDFWLRKEEVAEPFTENRLFAEEPGWVWLVRKKPNREEEVFCSASNGNAKREIYRQRLCHPKRKSSNLIREIPQAEQFWPLRGKRDEESWHDGLRDLKTFWPARGRRSEDQDRK
ncbi:UNVERIFIED_CONTAM: hypothetical protein PYX00_007378 [Menopon gallinae]|uniref:Uncharacterized protein n=1 Tax=Menopon gallinae TaxID=328185 RepID=A0AAW2HJ70_9NEOP